MSKKMKSSTNYLRLASFYAKENSGCLKVSVGSVIVLGGKVVGMGANRTDLNLCKSSRGCLRVEKYGNDAKDHRNPDDCRAVHSEIDAISSCPVDLTGSTIYVTRYPCEACARAIISSGITKVMYGRETPISDYTDRLFEFNHIEVVHVASYKEEDSLT